MRNNPRQEAVVFHENKVMNEIMPYLSDQCDVGIKKKMNSLPSFIMAKNIDADYIKIHKDKRRKKSEEKHRKLISNMRGE